MHSSRSSSLPARVALAALLASALAVDAAPVINEVHYEPPVRCLETEFVEIHNPDPDPVDLTGWRLADAVDFAFPEGTMIEGGGYLVVAQNPAVLQQNFGVSSLGPWTGTLDNDGEEVELRDAADLKFDAVDYRVRFPWPIRSSEGGSSMELIHPSLDNDLGSSWRPSQAPDVLPPLTYFSEADNWSYRPGTSEPSADWNTRGFVEGPEWIAAQTPMGFGSGGQVLNTILTDMRFNYPSVYLRHTFTVAPGELPQALLLRHNVDDGFVAFINGVEVARVRATGANAHGDIASTTQSPEGVWADLDISAGATVEGENILAIIAYNQGASSSDFAFDFELKRPPSPEPEPMPTPGRRNSVHAENAAPNIRQVDHSPTMPTSVESTVITAKVTDPDGIASVSVEYQVVAPGDYVPAFIPHTVSEMLAGGFSRDDPRDPSPDFHDPSNWTTLPMNDTGSDGDALAGDDIFSVTLPAQPHRHLMRYRIVISDVSGNSARVPYEDDPSLNFAYFTYDGVPDYNTNSGSFSSTMLTELPVYHLITRNGDMQTCRAYNGGDQLPKTSEARRTYNWEGAMVYDGVVYDHINYRLRGSNGRYQAAGKRSWKFRFNRGHYFDLKKQDGSSFKNKARVLETAKMFSNRQVGNFGMVDGVNGFLWRLMDVPAPETVWFHWRVIDGAQEAPNQFSGDFWGMSQALERYDVRFLEEHNLERGNLYKLVDGINSFEDQQRYQSCEPGAPLNYEDISQTKSQFTSARDDQWIRDHANLDKWYRFSAVKEAIRHYDWPSPSDKNMAWYFEPDYAPSNDNRGKLWLLPYDHDDTWGPVWNNGLETIKAAVNNKPEIRKEERNMVRAFRDLVWQPDQLNTLLDTFALPIVDFVDADRARWLGAPSIEGSENWGTLEGKIADMKRFAWDGGTWPGGSVGAGGRAAFLDSYANDNDIPVKPIITYSGTPGFPSNGLSFSSSAFTDPQGAATFAGMEYRIAEITPVGGGTVSLFPAGMTWKILDDGSDQGTAWRDPALDDSTWREGATPAGFGGITGLAAFETTIDYGPDLGNKYITTYFRKKINLSNIDTYDKIIFKLHADDGALIYVNGVEVVRDLFSPGVPIFFDTLSPGSGNESVFDEFEVDASFFVEGENTIAVEVHQNSRSSSDMVFDLAIDAEERLLPAGANLKMEWNADWKSGVLTSFQGTIDIPNAAVGAGKSLRARVRHLDNTGRWSHWSDPVQFVTTSPDVSEYLQGLVISEFMYNPPDSSAAEVAAGYQDQDFEWIEVMNVGDATLDLTDVRFTKGIDFDFAGSAVTSLAPGGVVLVVKNISAFEFRYGAGLPVAGAYGSNPEGSLSNGGEQLKLSFGGGIAIRDFDYDDDPPWPAAADGGGSSLVLINPESVPDHSLAPSWTTSAIPGGTPGTTGPTASLSDWQESVFTTSQLADPQISGPDADPDGDGLNNTQEFALGGDPLLRDPGVYPQVVIEGDLAFFDYRQQTAYTGITYTPEISYTGTLWKSAAPDLIQVSSTPNGDGTLTIRVRGAIDANTPDGRKALFRLRTAVE